MFWDRLLKRIFSIEIPEPPSFADRFVARVMSEEGKGEIGGNNAGPDVARWKRLPLDTEGNLGAWCARATAYCLEEALADGCLHDDLHPYELAAEYVRTPEPHPVFGVITEEVWADKSRAALGLARMLEHKFGARPAYAKPEPGMLALYKRPGEDWMYHVSPVFEVVDEFYRVMQFNVGRSPALAHATTHRVGTLRFGRLVLQRFIRTCPPP